jgi:hypothetical protein
MGREAGVSISNIMGRGLSVYIGNNMDREVDVSTGNIMGRGRRLYGNILAEM